MSSPYAPKFYVLVGREPRAVSSLEEWARTAGHGPVHVGDDTMANNVRVSTVFLGMDHRLFGEGHPLLFETMIFGGEHDGYQERYSTWAEAERGHADALKMTGNYDA